MSVIFHLDLDAFFVSVERILDPSLNGKAVIVGADPQKGRGVVSTCSYEAREYGVHSAMPISEAYRLCPHGIFIRGTHNEYSKYSNLVKDILEEYAPQIEQASVDEFYMDFTGTKHIWGSYKLLAEKIQKQIFDELKLPSSIGIASNKTLAKIGSDFNKPMGITHIVEGTEKYFLEKLPVESIPGVGKVTQRILKERGIYKVGDISKYPLEHWAKFYGKHGISLWKKANGMGAEILSVERKRKSISKERTFGSNVESFEELDKVLFKLSGKVAQSLRNKSFKCSNVGIKIRYSDFTTYTKSHMIDPTNDDKIIYNTALSLLKRVYTNDKPVRLVGVSLSHLSEFGEQYDLFENINQDRESLLKAVDQIRKNFGFDVIKIGSK